MLASILALRLTQVEEVVYYYPYRFCGFEQEISDYDIPKEELISSSSLKNGAHWKQIRIFFDYRYLDGTRMDYKMCKTAHKDVSWRKETYTCKQEHILTDEKIKIIKGTFNNIKSYLQRLLKVIPLTKPIKLINLHDYYFDHSEHDTINDIDFYMAITSRPRELDSPVFASASTIQIENLFMRPTQGCIYLNPTAIPNEIQNENSANNRFFFICVHEIFHVLGISSKNFKNFHPYEDRKPYSNPICKLSVKGKQMAFLTTPYAQKYAKKHYGVTIFEGDNGKICPAGIEFDNGEGHDTARSHLAQRTFFTELMTGATIQKEKGQFIRLTDASMALLQDTGNYKVDYRLVQPLVWGNPESINGHPIPNFALGSPQNVFPEAYIVNASRRFFFNTGFDYKYVAYSTRGHIPDCNDDKEYCKGKNFYNPNNQNVGEQPDFDYMNFFYPTDICPRGKAMIPSTLAGARPRCGEYACHGYSSFEWRFYDKLKDPNSYITYTCNKSNIGKHIHSYTYLYGRMAYYYLMYCPDPERFCRSVKLHEMHFTRDTFEDEVSTVENVDKNGLNAMTAIFMMYSVIY